jgi:hypothetical protein
MGIQHKNNFFFYYHIYNLLIDKKTFQRKAKSDKNRSKQKEKSDKAKKMILKGQSHEMDWADFKIM